MPGDHRDRRGDVRPSAAPETDAEDADESGRGLLIVTALTTTGSLSVGPDMTSAHFRLMPESLPTVQPTG
ncbi:hypothetical protein ACPCK9_25575 [Streptomyces koyangensis]|uniref:hypothetical protein n=1 Tax=Streptomyces koyangensis TaxID=188770 RepID=UPI0036F55F60